MPNQFDTVPVPAQKPAAAPKRVPTWQEVAASEPFKQMDRDSRDQARKEHFAVLADDAIKAGRLKDSEYDAAWNDYYLATQPDIDAGEQLSTTDKVLDKALDLGKAAAGGLGESLANKVIGAADAAEIFGRSTKESIRNKGELLFGAEATDDAFDAVGNVVDKLPFGNPAEPIRKLGEAAKAGARSEMFEVPAWKQGLDTDVAAGVGQVANQALVSVANAPVAAASFFTEMLAPAAEQMKDDPATNLLKEQDKVDYATLSAKQLNGQPLTRQEQRRLAYIDRQRQSVKDMAAVTSGAAQGALEKLSFDRMVKAIPPSIQNRITRVATDIGIAGVTEAATEALQGLTQDIIRWAATNPDAEIGSTLKDDATVGGLVGTMVRAAMPGTYRARPEGDDDADLKDNIDYSKVPDSIQPLPDNNPPAPPAAPAATPARAPAPTDRLSQLKSVDLSRALAEENGEALPAGSAPTAEEIRQVLTSDAPIAEIAQKAKLTAEGYQPVTTANGEVLYNPSTEEVKALGNIPLPKSPITPDTDPLSASVTLAAARQDTAQPTEAQAAAGNYPKGKISFHGLPIAIETPKGGTRSGKNQKGESWSVTMPVDYGYIARTEGADGDHLDVFIGNQPQANTVYVIDQKNPDGSFDEHKAMVGFGSEEEALQAYSGSFSDGKGPARVAGVVPMPMEQFKAWTKGKDTKSPLSPAGQFAARRLDTFSEKFEKMPVRQQERYRKSIEQVARAAGATDYLDELDQAILMKKNPATRVKEEPVKDIGRTRGIRRAPRRQADMSILDFIGSVGGMYDDRGELRSRGLQDWHKGKAFRPRIVRESPNVGGMFGAARDARNTPDGIALAAWERGFFPMHQERPTEDDLYALIDNEFARQGSTRRELDDKEKDFDQTEYEAWVLSNADNYGIDIEGKSIDEVYLEISSAMEAELSDASPELMSDMIYEMSYHMNQGLEASGMGDIPFDDTDIPFDAPLTPPTQIEEANEQQASPAEPAAAAQPTPEAEPVSAEERQQADTAAAESPAELPESPDETGQAGTESFGQDGFSFDSTNIGQQAVIPGAERISDKQQAERTMDAPLRAAKPQKEAGADGGLFDTGSRQQVDMFDQNPRTYPPVTEEPTPLLGDNLPTPSASSGYDSNKVYNFRTEPHEALLALSMKQLKEFGALIKTPMRKDELVTNYVNRVVDQGGLPDKDIAYKQVAFPAARDPNQMFKPEPSAATDEVRPEMFTGEIKKRLLGMNLAEMNQLAFHAGITLTPKLRSDLTRLYGRLDDLPVSELRSAAEAASEAMQESPKPSEQPFGAESNPSEVANQPTGNSDALSEDFFSVFPTKEMGDAYSGTSYRTGDRGKMEYNSFVKYITEAYTAAQEKAETPAQREALDEAAISLRDDYIAERKKVAAARRGVLSSSIAGRSNFNSKQSSRRGSSLDRAIEAFSTWENGNATRLLSAVENAKTPDQVAQEIAVAKEKRAATIEKDAALLDRLKDATPSSPVKVGPYSVIKLNYGKDGKPTSLTFAPDENIIKGVNDKLPIAKLFKGRIEEILAYSESKQPATEQAPEPAADVTDNNVGETPKKPEISSGPYTIQDHSTVSDGLDEGIYSAEEVKDLFKRAYDSAEELKAEIGKLTKDQIASRFGVRNGASEKKDWMVKSAYDNILSDFHYGESFSWSPMEEKLVDAYKRLVMAQTDADVVEGVRQRKERDAANKQYAKDLTRTLTGNPETLDEFRTFIRANGMDKLTPEQLAEYDALATNSMMEQKAAQKEKKAEVSGIAQPVSGEINAEVIQTKHTQKGHDLFVVKLTDRVEKDTYTTLNTAAKRLGGYYSSYRGMGATPGFQFTTQDAADKFLAVLAGDTVTADMRARVSTASEKLEAQAQRLIEAGTEKMEQDRKSNTARRAAMAASAEASAAGEIAMGKTMQAIATLQKEGKAGILADISARTEIDALHSVMRRAMYERDRGLDLDYSERQKREGRKFDNEDAQKIEYPYPSFHLDSVPKIADELSKKAGYKLLAQHLNKLYQAAKKKDQSSIRVVDPKFIAKIKDAAAEFENTMGWYAEEGVAHYLRLQRIGITHAAYLRHAVREYANILADKPKADPVKEAERKLAGRKWEGYFPTPMGIAERMADELQVNKHHRVLEPSAGKGTLIDAVVNAGADPANVEALEIVGDLRDVLQLKGYNIVGRDFMEHEGEYDKIIMNPPFEKGQDIDHVRKAYSMLLPGGKVVAIMSEGPFFRKDTKAAEFRAWLDEMGGTSEQLPEGSFKDSDRSTGVATRLVIIEKPDDVKYRSTEDGAAQPPVERISYKKLEKYSEKQKVYGRNVKRILRQSFGENLNLQYVDRLVQPSGFLTTGLYKPAEMTAGEALIMISLGGDSNPYAAIKHEGIHHLRRLGALDAVWGDLRRMAESKWIEQYAIERSYPDVPGMTREQMQEIRIEEAIAEAFADYATITIDGKPNRLPVRIETTFRKIKAFFDSLRSYMAGEGYTTWRNIFEDIDSGKYRPSDGAVARANMVQADMAQQKAITETDAFKKWFGKSKVVDANGKPLVVYHGTDDPYIKAFRDDFQYFSSSPKVASGYARGAGANSFPNVMQTYLSFKNPLVIDAAGAMYDSILFERGKNWTVDALAVTAKERGYDSLIVERVIDEANSKVGRPETVYVAFAPTQIKSINNQGTFDPVDPRILFQQQIKQNDHKKEKAYIAAMKAAHKGSTPLKRWAKRNLTKEGLLGETAFELNIQKDGTKNVSEHRISRMVKDLDADVKAAYGKSYNSLTARERASLRDYLAGVEGANVPDAIKPRVAHMREYLDRGSARMQDSIAQMVEIKIAALPEKQRDQAELYLSSQGTEGRLPGELLRLLRTYQTIETNKGTYLNRSYQAFDDEKWLDKALANKEIMDEATAYIKEQNPSYDDARVLGEIRAILREAQEKGNFVSFLSGGSKAGQKDVSFLKQRKDVPKAIRVLLGEYEDPKVNFVRSATKMDNWLANQQFLYNLRVAGMDTFLFTEPTGEYDKLIASEGNDTMSPLDGLYTTADFVQGMQDIMDSGSDAGFWLQVWLRFNSAVKYGKTIGSPTTQFRNFYSGAFFAIINGHWNFTHTGKALKAIAADFRRSNAKWDDYLQELIELGVLHDNPYSGELRLAIDDFIKTESFVGQDKMKVALEFFQKLYQSSDDFWKINGFENEMARLRRLRPEMTELDRKKLAAKRIRNGYPTYSMVPRLIRAMRRFPVTGSFVSFTWESMRTYKNQFEIMAEDYRHGGISSLPGRASGFAVATALFAALSSMSMAFLGLDDEDDEAIRDLAPYWQKNAQIYYLGYDDEGRPIYLDMSFLDPYSYVKRPLTALLNGNNVGITKKAVDALSEVFMPYIGLEIGTRAILEVLVNKNLDTGLPVYIEQDTAEGITSSIAAHLTKLLPGIYNNAKGMQEALTDQTLPRGKERTVQDEALAFMGIRRTTLSVPTSLRYKAFDFADSERSVSRILTQNMGKASNISKEDIKEAYDRMVYSREITFGEIRRAVGAAKKLNLTDAQIRESLRAGMMSYEDIAAVMQNTATPKWRMQKTFLAGVRAGAILEEKDAEKRAKITQEIVRRARILQSVMQERK